MEKTNKALGTENAFLRKEPLTKQSDIKNILSIQNKESFELLSVVVSLITYLNPSDVILLILKDLIIYKQAESTILTDYYLGLNCKEIREISAIFFELELFSRRLGKAGTKLTGDKFLTGLVKNNQLYCIMDNLRGALDEFAECITLAQHLTNEKFKLAGVKPTKSGEFPMDYFFSNLLNQRRAQITRFKISITAFFKRKAETAKINKSLNQFNPNSETSIETLLSYLSVSNSSVELEKTILTKLDSSFLRFGVIQYLYPDPISLSRKISLPYTKPWGKRTKRRSIKKKVYQ